MLQAIAEHETENPMKNIAVKIRCLFILIAAAFAALPACAQLAPANSSGVTMLRQADPTGPPAGSIVDHFGFAWKDMPTTLAKWKADGVEIEQTGNPNQGYVHGPDGIRVEFFGDPSLSTPVAMNHIHFYPVDIPAMQAWYAKMFGGVPGKRARQSTPGWIDCDDIPGTNLSFSQGKAGLVPTKGRSLDHIGFDVKDLEAFTKKLEAAGIKLDEGPRLAPNGTTKVAYITDPWGTRIELTEKLAP
jgi:catechol 2,3-dioxygenase-like lactoylglutathione lyase family enzyme